MSQIRPTIDILWGSLNFEKVTKKFDKSLNRILIKVMMLSVFIIIRTATVCDLDSSKYIFK